MIIFEIIPLWHGNRWGRNRTILANIKTPLRDLWGVVSLGNPKTVMKKLITPLLSAAIIFGGLFIESTVRADNDKAPNEKPATKKSM